MRDPRHLWQPNSPRHATFPARPLVAQPGRLHHKALVATSIILGSVALTLAPVHGLDYTIAPGDALWTIASEHGVSVDDIVDVNRIDDANVIVAGHTLLIPAAVSESAAGHSSRTGNHHVEPGDTLWGIAAQYDVPLGALARLNGVGGDALIRSGQVLALPDASGSTGTIAAATVTQRTPDQATNPTDAGLAMEAAPVHSVVDGESAWGIAQRWHVGLDDLLDANDMTRRDVLRVGQQLIIPTHGSLSIDKSKLPADLANSTVRLGLMPVFDYWANAYNVPTDLLKALAWFESGWNNEKRSSANAIGIGQILPITADFVSESLVGETLDPEIPEENIRLSARYLRYLLDEAGSMELAVASYYQGLTATRQHGIYASSEFYVEGILDMRELFR